MNLPFLDRFVECAAKKVGDPYIWAGKGTYRLDPNGNMPALAVQGYDCSGLVTCSLLEAGGPDHRNNWNAQLMFNLLEHAPAARAGSPVLAFFGADQEHIHHVGIALDGDVYGWFCEAAGGDETTLAPTPGSRVYLHRGAFWPASACQGYRSIPTP